MYVSVLGQITLERGYGNVQFLERTDRKGPFCDWHLYWPMTRIRGENEVVVTAAASTCDSTLSSIMR